MSFDQTLSEWRENHGLSCAEAGTILGVTSACISRWETKNRKPHNNSAKYIVQTMQQYSQHHPTLAMQVRNILDLYKKNLVTSEQAMHAIDRILG